MKKFRFSLLAAAAILAAGYTGPTIAQYRWTDAQGKVSYGDMPPRDAKNVRLLTTRPAAVGEESAAASLPFEVRRAVERAPVVLYTAPDCSPCAPAASMLRERGVPYTERTVTSPDDLQELRRISGGLRLPYVTVGSQAQGGFNADLWMSLLDAAGYPKGSMLPRSYQWPAPQPLVPPQKTDGAAAQKADGAPAQSTAAARPPAEQPTR